MNDKEFNLQILAALTEYANELTAAGRVTVEEDGQYTAYNLAKGGKRHGRTPARQHHGAQRTDNVTRGRFYLHRYALHRVRPYIQI